MGLNRSFSLKPISTVSLSKLNCYRATTLSKWKRSSARWRPSVKRTALSATTYPKLAPSSPSWPTITTRSWPRRKSTTSSSSATAESLKSPSRCSNKPTWTLCAKCHLLTAKTRKSLVWVCVHTPSSIKLWASSVRSTWLQASSLSPNKNLTSSSCHESVSMAEIA